MTQIKVISHDYHRNGISGQWFVVVKFIDAVYGSLIATINNATDDMFVIDPLDINNGFSSEHFADVLDYARKIYKKN